MGSIQQSTQAVVGESIAVTVTVCRPAHCGDVAVVAGGTVIVGQRLSELTTRNAGQPTTDVVGIG